MRKLMYEVNGLEFSTMRDAAMVAKAANTHYKTKLIPVIESIKVPKERYEKLKKYFQKRRMEAAASEKN